MTCNEAGGCVFDYQASTTTVSGITATFDGTNIKATVTGTGFPVGDVANTELWVDGKKQQTDSVSADTAVFTLTHALNNWSQDIKFYTAEGLP